MYKVSLLRIYIFPLNTYVLVFKNYYNCFITTINIILFRFLSLNTVVAYQRAKILSLNIVNSDNSGTATHVATISHTVSVDLTKAEPAMI